MKYLKAFIIGLCLGPNLAFADMEVIGGGLTYHLIDNGTASKYSNKLSSDGRLISNPMIGLSFIDHSYLFYASTTVFYGENSVGHPMVGGLFSEGLEADGVQVGIAYGLYAQESHYYTDLNIHSFRATNISGIDLVPVLGLSLNYKIELSKDYYLKLNNLLSPILTNTSLAIGRSF